MRALVKGGNRHIGVDLVNELVAGGHDVTVVDSHETALPPIVKQIHCDRTMTGALQSALHPYCDAFDIVFDHTAYTVADMEPLIELFRGRIEQYVFTCSQAVYRRSLAQPLTEEAERIATDGSALPAPALARRRASSRARAHGFGAMILRGSSRRSAPDAVGCLLRGCASDTLSYDREHELDGI